jgi:hypothetical protein
VSGRENGANLPNQGTIRRRDGRKSTDGISVGPRVAVATFGPLVLRRSRNRCRAYLNSVRTERFFFSFAPILAENPGSTLNTNNSIRRLIGSRWICLPVAALLFLSGRCVNADPVGDFFKKVGQSISKAFQPPTPPNQTEKKTKRPSRRPGSRISNIAEASPTPVEQPPNVAQEAKFTPTITVLRASAVSPEKAKGDMPYGIPVPGQKGMVTSPYLPDGNYIDVSGFPPGSAVRDPYTRKIFLVP